jgi:hypothetical protein
MSVVLLDTQLLLIALVGVGGSILGLLCILGSGRSGSWWLWVNAVVGLVLLSAAVRLATMGMPLSYWATLAGLGTLALFFWGISSPTLGWALAKLLRLVRDRRFQGALVLLCCAGVALWWVDGLGTTTASENLDLASFAESVTTLSFLEATEARAFTDRGRPVPLYHVAIPETPSSDLAANESRLLSHLTSRFIRTAPPDMVSNCHGWLFAAGQFWVRGTEVPLILEDNGYRKVEAPIAGDLVVFHNDQGMTLHTAVVRAAANDGLVLLEGKWGVYGRFIHAPADQHYSPQWTYYHSDRLGAHRLHGLGGETASDPSEELIPTN